MKVLHICLAALVLALSFPAQLLGQTGADQARILDLVEVFFDACE